MEIVYYTIPSVVMLIGVFFIVNRFLIEESNRLNIMLKQSISKENQKISLPLRYQAYERLVLLLERMHPLQVIGRNPAPSISAAEYKTQLILDMNTEMQYNLTQQIYVSADIWQLILQVKQQMQMMMIEIADALPEKATAQDFSDALLTYVNSTEPEKLPINVGLKYLKNEVAQIH